MQKLIKIVENVNQTVFLTSDLHRGHNKTFVYAARGYASVEAHDKALIETINSTVREQDIIINCGDLSLNTTREQLVDFLSQIKCKNHYLLWGNHPNPIHGMYKEEMDKYYGGRELYPYTITGVTLLGDYQEFEINKKRIVCSHYPLKSWSGMNRGAFCATGHRHMNRQDTLAEPGKILDVGWDAWGKPISFSEVKSILDKKDYVSDGGHH